MAAHEKPDAAQIRSFLQELSNQDWVRRTERRVWPQYAFHYTDLRNAVRILETKSLLSRQQLEIAGALPVSSGSSEVLSGTETWIKDCVRFYFRPKTPTQYHAEGVKSQAFLASSKFPDAHCPAPVFFLFDLADVLCRQETKFSDRGLGSHAHRILSTADDLRRLDWPKIYHNGPIDPSQDVREVTACRNAEIIAPHSLALDSLKFIYCRSEPELETLLHLLPSSTVQQYRRRILSSTRSDLFNRHHTFLESVRLSAQSVVLSFSPETKSPGPFALVVEFFALKGIPIIRQKAPAFYVRNATETYRWEIKPPAPEYMVKVYLDEALIYANRYTGEDLPF